MVYSVITSSETVRDIDDAVFYKEGLGMYPENILKFKQNVVDVIRKLADSPKTGANLSARVDEPTNVKYSVIDDYILFYEIDDDVVKVLRLLPAKSNWMNTILKYL
ncbi:type II toxin-antitoxin system RelE/ParE family toxin (plasmid) [Streptococcus canis]|uniref:type II toxin-antitoxin system RelE/ParE family toxin n=1 Tax=Streptococcus canis TaxID=1329 RepID=UPI0013DB881F|nr:type II toxin-antitoxin system RelE/ParE family toxin [Streptococcus canis]QKG76686.1 type II toxin-antitoxin system RelE/ParE family toxin [Streptococcus canis]